MSSIFPEFAVHTSPFPWDCLWEMCVNICRLPQSSILATFSRHNLVKLNLHSLQHRTKLGISNSPQMRAVKIYLNN